MLRRAAIPRAQSFGWFDRFLPCGETVNRLQNNPRREVIIEKGATRKQLWHEMMIAARFGIVGMVSTAVHIMIVWLLLVSTASPPRVANTFAFLTAFGISFVGNYRWTFGSPGNLRRAIKRFLLISVSAFAVNTLLLAVLLRGEWFSPIVAAIFSAAVVPFITFLTSRFWGFQSREEGA